MTFVWNECAKSQNSAKLGMFFSQPKQKLHDQWLHSSTLFHLCPPPKAIIKSERGKVLGKKTLSPASGRHHSLSENSKLWNFSCCCLDPCWRNFLLPFLPSQQSIQWDISASKLPDQWRDWGAEFRLNSLQKEDPRIKNHETCWELVWREEIGNNNEAVQF